MDIPFFLCRGLDPEEVALACDDVREMDGLVPDFRGGGGAWRTGFGVSRVEEVLPRLLSPDKRFGVAEGVPDGLMGSEDRRF